MENSVPPDEDSDRDSSTGSHPSIDHPPTMETCVPPDDALVTKINLFTKLFNSNDSELQALINKLKAITDSLETTHRNATIGNITGGVIGAAGGITSIVGLVLAPFTLGASLVVTGIGVGVAVAGGVTGAASNTTDMVQQKTSQEEIEDILKKIQEKMTPLIEHLKDIENYLHENIEIGSGITTGLVCAVNAARLVKNLTKLSKTLRAAGAFTEVLSGLLLVLDIVSNVKDAQELNEIDKRKKDRSEKSDVVRFIEDMRKTQVELRNLLEEMRKIKNEGSSTASHRSLDQPPTMETSVPPDEDSDRDSSTASHPSLDHPPSMENSVPPDEDSDRDSSTASHPSIDHPPSMENSVLLDEDSDSDSCTASHGSLNHPPSMENSVPPDEDKSTASHPSIDQPPSVETSVPPEEALITNKKSYINRFNENEPPLQVLINKLKAITDSLETTHRNATIGSITGGVIGAAGGIATIAGVILAPFTMGASLIVTGIGAGVAIAGDVTGATSNTKDMVQQKISQEEIENILKNIQKNITPLTEHLKDIENNPHESIKNIEIGSVLTTGLVRAANTVRLVKNLTKLFKTLRAAGAFTAVLSGLFVVLDVVSIVKDVQELNEIDKRKKDGSEKSDVVRFIQDMRKTQVELQYLLEEMRVIKNQFEREMI